MEQVTKLTLLQRINEVRKAIGYVQKNKDVSTGGGSYRAVTHDVVTAMVRPAMIDHGIVCWPSLVASTSNPKDEGAKQFRYEATYDFVFASVDDMADQIIIRIQSHAMDNADKAPGKALSYAKKYAVLKLFEIETGEDEESRYADTSLDDDDLAEYLDAIGKAPDMDALKAVFAASYNTATESKDKSAAKLFIKAKDARKLSLALIGAAA